MTRYAPLLALAVGLLVALTIAVVEVSRDDGDPESSVASFAEATLTPTTSATASPPSSTLMADVLGRDVSFAENGRHWARAIVGSGGTGLTSPFTVVQPDGTIVLAATVGTYETTSVDAGGGPIPVAGGEDIVLAALAPDGRHLWSQLLGGPGDDYASSIALAEDGGFLLVGTFEPGIDFGSGPVQGASGPDAQGLAGRDAFLARFEVDGTLRWMQAFGGEYTESGGSLVVLPDGDLMISGLSSAVDTLELGNVLVERPGAGRYWNYLARLSPSGEVRWAESISGVQLASPISRDAESGDLIVATRPLVPPDEEPGPGVNGLIRFSDDGTEVWRRTFEDGYASWRRASLALDTDGSIVVASMTEDTLDLGGGSIGPSDRREAFLARFSPSGDHVWSQTIGRTFDYVDTVVTDRSGDIWIAGGALIERYDSEGNLEAQLDLDDFVTFGITPEVSGGGHSIGRMGTLIVEGAAIEEGEILIGGRFQARAVFPFNERLLTSHWLPHFLARIEAP